MIERDLSKLPQHHTNGEGIRHVTEKGGFPKWESLSLRILVTKLRHQGSTPIGTNP